MTSERQIQNAIRLALGGHDVLLWRNETGATVPCRLSELQACRRDGAMLEKLIARGVIRYGLCPGSSDLVGLRKDGRFVAIEVKSETGAWRPEQERFTELVRSFGGLAGFATSIEEARAIVSEE